MSCLCHLVPPVTAIEAWPLFDEGRAEVADMALVTLGVCLLIRRRSV